MFIYKFYMLGYRAYRNSIVILLLLVLIINMLGSYHLLLNILVEIDPLSL